MVCLLFSALYANSLLFLIIPYYVVLYNIMLHSMQNGVRTPSYVPKDNRVLVLRHPLVYTEI